MTRLPFALAGLIAVGSLTACQSEADKGAELAARACQGWEQSMEQSKGPGATLGDWSAEFREQGDLASQASRYDSQWHYLADAFITVEEYASRWIGTNTNTREQTQQMGVAHNKISRECRKFSDSDAE